MSGAPRVELLSAVRGQDFPDEWYDASAASHFWFRWRLAALERALADAGPLPGGPLTLLDVGCGSGVLAAQLEAARGWTVDGTDLNLPALERCAPRRGRTFYYDVTEERPELLGRYDGAVLFDVLEHLPDPGRILRSTLRHVRPGGLLLVNVPALPSLMSAYDRAAGHLRRYTRRSLSAELAGQGVEERVIRYWGLSLVPLLWVRKAVLAGGGPRTIERGFVPPHPAVNAALAGLMHLETRALRSPPVGTSVLHVGVKAG
ncbi:MAG: class I SAM-dependent methyltransferase [Anaeromyxobacter sp.]